ncbi:MAG: hypothetical protein HC803_11260 [Saprospiraceae bacterium]|nr:hypothetical protein [Saprospiraceae bacterium]
MCIRKIYHTQEHRENFLTLPKKCLREDAWLGDAYYFWYSELDADKWGETSKRTTGEFEVYESEADCENILDTVFNEEHYLFWLKQIEKVALKIIKKTGKKPTIKEINDYFKDKGEWNEVTGIMFQDLPLKANESLVAPIKYRNKNIPFYYRKRIQLAIYDLKIIQNFKLKKVQKC